MSGNYFDYMVGHARLAILRALLEAPGHAANDSVLTSVTDGLGLPITRDQLRTQLGWLEEQQLVRLSRPAETVIVATLRERGADVAIGRSFVDGIQRPSVAR